MSVKVFYHGSDMDGWGSAAVLCQWNKQIEKRDLFPIDYGRYKLTMDIVKENITSDDIVFIVDISFTKDTVDVLKYINKTAKETIWIDHHDSSIELCKSDEEASNIKGIRSKKSSAILLTYNYVIETYSWAGIFNVSPLDYISDWDTFTHSFRHTIAFKYGIDQDSYFKYPRSSQWKKLFASNEYMYDIIKKGWAIYDFITNDYSTYFRSNGYESVIPGTDIKVAVCNRSCNSLLFGDKYKEYPAVVTFSYDGENYKYSIYANQNVEHPFNCKEVAEKYGGGGHHGAAGFVSDELLFPKTGDINFEKVEE